MRAVSLLIYTASRIFSLDEQQDSVESHTPENILIVRTDRIGDVVLSLPMVSVLRASFPTAQLSMLLRSYTKPLAEGYHGLDRIVLYDDLGIEKSLGRMIGELRSEKFDAVVVSYPTFRLAALMYLARIPRRIGTGYRWYSFLFNKRVYEHRKTAEKHEAEYNLSLLKSLGCNVSPVPTISLPISNEDEEGAKEIRVALNLQKGERVAVLHPGSGGSARDWGVDNFAELTRLLSNDNFQVLISGGPGESTLVDQVVRRSGNKGIPLTNIRNLKLLAAFLKSVDIFISNSTGPLHIAAAVGTPVIGLYPPILACSPVRWGPLTSKNRVFVPNANECPRCKGGACEGNECMDLITPKEVFAAVKGLVAARNVQPKVGV